MSDFGTCVHTAAGEFEAQQIKAFLKGNGITCRIEGEALRNTHGLTVDGLGAARIMVPDELADEARSLLAHAEAGELTIEDEPAKGGTLLPFRQPED
jgi:hypothetical protein